mgnify:CR=1 FL=1
MSTDRRQPSDRSSGSLAKPADEKPLISISDLRIAFRRRNSLNEVVHGIDLDIGRHETLALVGESGSGKTVTAASILRLLPAINVHYPSGRILFNAPTETGRSAGSPIDLLAAPEAQLLSVRGNDIGMVFQEPMSSLNPLHTIEKQIAETLFIHRGMGLEKSRPIALQWLQKVGIRSPEERLKAYPHQLSGGERQRVMIAMALINEPRLLIADEPTTSLDVTIQAQILELIAQLQSELQMAVLFITHDLSIVKRIADRVAVMQDGRIVETDESRRIFTNPRHEYTRTLINAELDAAPPKPEKELEPLIKINDLKVWFPIQRGFFRITKGHIKAVDGLNLEIKRGQSLGVVGESGSGKTTLGKALLRLEKSEGSILFRDTPVNELSEKQLRPLRKSLQVIFQDPYGSLSPRMSVEQIIGEGLDLHKIVPKEEREDRIISAMEEVGLDPGTRFRYPNEFSGGQRQRVALARALVLKPDFIVLDEPTSSLDRSIQFQVVDLLRKLQIRHGLTYMFISHDLKVVKSLCHEIVIMRAGKIVERGPAEDIFTNPQHEYTRELLKTAFN